MKKTQVLVAIGLALLCCCVCLGAMAAEQGTCGADLTWTLDDQGKLTVSGTGEMNDYAIDAHPPWYDIRGSILSVVVRPGVTGIGTFAFYECTNLKSAELPDSVTSIRYCGFAKCSGLSSVTIPGRLTNIGEYAFQLCSNLESITVFGDKLQIGKLAFQLCDKLKAAVLTGSVESIGDHAFFGASALKDIWFAGSREEWDAIPKATDWEFQTPSDKTIHVIAFAGKGTEANPYLIRTAEHWETLRQFIANGAYDTAEKVFWLDAPLQVTTMIGTAGNPFRGTFDGNGKTLTVNLTATSGGKGPFAYVSDAIFKHLRVAGTIRTNVNDTGGLVGQAAGGCAIIDCVSCVEIVVNGGSGHAGFVGSFSENVAIAGSLFTGHIGGSRPRYCAGFVGKGGGTVDDSIYDGRIDSGGSENNTFLRQRDYAANCYYLNAAGIQRIKGKQGFSVAAGQGVTLDFGEPKAVYPTSGITAYPTGLVYDGVFYAGSDETVSLMPGSAVPEGQYANYVTDAGSALRRGDRTWFLDMQDRAAVIRAEFADLPAAFGAPDVILPSRLTAIEADAFAATAAKAVRVSDGCQSIGAHAFRDSGALREIRIPAGCALGEDVFTGCPLVFVFGKAGSPAEEYCNSHVNTIFIAE